MLWDWYSGDIYNYWCQTDTLTDYDSSTYKINLKTLFNYIHVGQWSQEDNDNSTLTAMCYFKMQIFYCVPKFSTMEL